MNALLGKIAGAVATFFVALILNKFFSTFRIRQLYLAYEHILEHTTQSITGYTVMFTVTNKGKEKEKNVTITIPKSKSISLISANNVSIECKDNKIIIDRILPKENITLIVLVKNGGVLSKSNLPILKSEDANGKCYDSIKKIPPSLGPAFFSFSLFIAFLALMGGAIYKGYDPFEVTYTQYFKMRFTPFYDRGFENNSFQNNSLTKQYDTPKSDFPIDLKSLNVKDGKIEYIFIVDNKTNYNLSADMKFIVRDENQYYDELGKVLNIRSDSDRRQALHELRDKYHVAEDTTGATYSISEWIDKGQRKEIKMTRQLSKGIDYKDLGVDIRIRNDANDDNYYGDYQFKPERSAIARNKLDAAIATQRFPLK